MQWARRMRFTMATIYGIIGYFLAVLITNYPIQSLIGFLFVVAVTTGVVNLKNDNGRMPNA